jgi:hypothetical protein
VLSKLSLGWMEQTVLRHVLKHRVGFAVGFIASDATLGRHGSGDG